VYRWVVYLIPVPDLLPANGVWSIDVATRVIASGETLLVAQWLVLGLVFGAWRLGPLAVARWLAPALFTAVVVLQHRSVWIAGVVGLLAAWSLGRRAQGSRPLQAAILAAAVAVVAVPAVLSDRLAPLTREIGQSAANAATGQGTVHARLSDWRRALREFAGEGPRTWLVGQGYGRDTSRITFTESGERRVVRFGLHNHYLALLVHHGLLGLAAYLALIGGTAWALWQRVRSTTAHDPEAWIAPVLLVLLAMQTAYHLPYAGDPLQHLLLGVAVAYAARVRLAVAGSGRGADGASTTTGAAGAVVPRRTAAHDVAWR
jgi:O-antigen ligase